MLKDHQISITSANDINAICQPLFQNSKLSHFEFMRVFPDRSCIWLTSNASFVKTLSSMRWSHLDKKNVDNIILATSGYYPWSCHNFPSKRRLIAFQEFNIDHGLTIKENCKLYQDYFIFGTVSNNFETYQFCFNNIEFINKFTYYFKDKSSFIIKKATKEKIFIPNSAEELKDKLVVSNDNSRKFIKDMQINKYNFTLDGQVISLSVQEFNSIRLLARGYTVKEAGKYLNISPRTLEYYIKCSRNKMNLNTNRELISVYWQSNLKKLD